MPSTSGFHHITAIASDPSQNLHFYKRVLGLRLIKITVNFDDPGSYHLYYGSSNGAPGSILTFFPWVSSAHGSRSTGETSTVALAIPEGALSFWKTRLQAERIRFETGLNSITFADPDGLQLELVEAAKLDPALRWNEGPVSPAHAVHGIHHIALEIYAPDVAATQSVLKQHLGIEAGTLVTVDSAPARKRGRMGPGIVHHIAWRASNDAEQAAWQLALSGGGLHVTPVQDRQYFHSIYFREPGGVLYEIATDNPGFLTDESLEELGTRLQLPPWLESERTAIEAALPALTETFSCQA